MDELIAQVSGVAAFLFFLVSWQCEREGLHTMSQVTGTLGAVLFLFMFWLLILMPV